MPLDQSSLEKAIAEARLPAVEQTVPKTEAEDDPLADLEAEMAKLLGRR